jgi:hypothetical protein
MVSRWSATTVVLVVLLLASAASLWLGTTGVFPNANHAAIGIAVLALAFAKIWLIVRYFMEVRFGPPWLRIALDLWLVIAFAAVTTLFLMTP